MRAVVAASLAVVLSCAPGYAGRALESLKSVPVLNGPVVLPADAPVPKLPPGGVQSLRVRPDPAKTPGRLCTPDDPDFLEYRYPERVAYCKRHVTKAEKRRVAEAYGIPESDWGNYEFDHLIPLAIGGSSLEDNIWPEPRGDDESDGKDKLEYSLYKRLAAGAITQDQAVREMMAWFEGATLSAALRRPTVKDAGRRGT